VILDLHVQPGAKKSQFAGEHGGRIKLRLAAPAVEGKANLKSRQKRVVIEGAEWKTTSKA
jgi:uncharacterized protein YggU (UPF0235/DUF167 family)